LKGLKPDLTLLLDAPLDIGFERIRHRERDHFEQEGREFFERVRRKYHEIAMREPERVKVIDAAQTVEGVQMSLRAALDQYTREHEIA
jgi:dTMP kinase